MAQRLAHSRLHATSIDFAALRRELELPLSFPLAAQEQAEQAAQEATLPELDRTDLPLVTIDPPGARDLDQALCVGSHAAGGFRVHYAIADVASFVTPGSTLEKETWRRGQTIYFPDRNVPLHPKVLSEQAVSLLPGVDRAAVLWTIDVTADGEIAAIRLERAQVRSRAQLDYATVQDNAVHGSLPDSLRRLPELGKLLIARGLARDAIDLPLPEQDVEPHGSGWRLVLRAPVPAEAWNAQISLLTGRAAARIMLDGGVGMLRTMPAPEPETVGTLRRAARALGIPWGAAEGVGAALARIDPSQPRSAAFVEEAADLMRGAGYTAFKGTTPDENEHAAVAAPYAHVTAPLRRLADRYVTEVCLALAAEREVPSWAEDALPDLPGVMASTSRVANTADREAVDLVEATLLEHRVGDNFPAVVLDTNERRTAGTIAISEPAVRARCDGDLEAGEKVYVRLTEANPTRRRVRFALA